MQIKPSSHTLRKCKITNVGEDAEKLELSDIASGNVK